MPRFEYIATNKEGKEFSGTLEGDGPQDVTAKLKQEGLEVTSMRLLREKPLSPFGIPRGVSPDDLSIFNGQLASMVEAELPLAPSLKQIAKDVRSRRFKTVIEDVARDVESGNSLYESLSKHPDVFSEFYLKVVDAGEKTSNLAGVLSQLTKYSLRMLSFRRRIRDALIYPCLVLAVGLGLIIVLCRLVIPTFTAMFSDLGANLPKLTLLIISISDLFRYRSFQIVLGLIVFIWLPSFLISRTPRGRVVSGRIKISIPFAGPVLRYIAIVHLSRTLGTLLSGGVPMVEALELAGRSTPNGAIEEAVKGVVRSVEQGEPLSDSLQKTALFPPSMIWMLSIGEKRGKLDGYLLHNAEMYQERLEGSLRTTEIVVAPLAILILGIFIFFVVMALFLPLMQLGMLIGGG